MTNDPTTLAALTADPANRRSHGDRNLALIASALKDVGAARSIVIDEDNVILAGNGVTQAAAAAGVTKLRVVEASGDEIIAVRRRGLTEAQKRALALYDNRTAELAEWNVEQLFADQQAGLDLASYWDEAELSTLFTGIAPKAGLTDPDAVPEVRATEIQRGDLFALGAHRLLCGDSTIAADVARLMGEASADLVFTSPPYGQQRDYGSAIRDWNALMLGAFANLPTHDETQILVNLGLIHRDGEWIPYWDDWITWMRERGWRRFGWYVWDQGPGMPGDWNGRLATSHEFVFHFNRASRQAIKARDCKHAGEAHGGKGQRGVDGVVKERHAGHAPVQPRAILDTVIRVNRQGASHDAGGHPAPFPVGLPEAFLASWPGDIYEPFVGSGTTLIAAQRLAAQCFAIEIEPQYCQVTLDRWEAFTGQTAQKVGEAIR